MLTERNLITNDRISLGTRVRYHGANEAARGDYFIDNYYLYAGERVYDLWPVGVSRKDARDKDSQGLYRVKRKFLTVLG